MNNLPVFSLSPLFLSFFLSLFPFFLFSVSVSWRNACDDAGRIRDMLAVTKPAELDRSAFKLCKPYQLGYGELEKLASSSPRDAIIMQPLRRTHIWWQEQKKNHGEKASCGLTIVACSLLSETTRHAASHLFPVDQKPFAYTAWSLK